MGTPSIAPLIALESAFFCATLLHRRETAAGNAIESRKFPQGADYCGLCELLDRMMRAPLDSKKYSTMNIIARLAAPPALLILALVFSAALARADELQDINALVKQGQHAKALERVNEYLAQKPGDPKGRFAKGLILAEQNKVAEAIEVFTALVRDYPSLPEPYNNLAVLYAAQGQYEKARQELELSIRTHPSYATAYENLGDVYTKLASQAYDKALQFDSSNSAAKNKLSLIRDLISSNRPPAASSAPAAASLEAAQLPSAMGPEPKSAEGKPNAAEATAAKVANQRAPAQNGGAEGAIPVAVSAWADAGSNQKVESYHAFYAPEFKTPKGEARSEWEAARRERISKHRKIEVAG